MPQINVIGFLLGVFLCYVQAIEVAFIFPPPMPTGSNGTGAVQTTFKLGEPVVVNWTTPDIFHITLAIWQEGNNSFQYLPNSHNMSNQGYFKWTVDVSGKDENPSFDIPHNGNRFFFSLFNEGHTGPAANSDYFRIDISTPFTTSSSSASAVSSTTASPIPTASSTGNMIGDKGSNNNGVKIGVGVGVGVGGTLLVIAAVLFLLSRRGRKPNAVPNGHVETYHEPEIARKELDRDVNRRSELPGEAPTFELPSNSVPGMLSSDSQRHLP